jgi:hypothetical protein
LYICILSQELDESIAACKTTSAAVGEALQEVVQGVALFLCFLQLVVDVLECKSDEPDHC